MASGGMQDWQSISHSKAKPYQKQEQFPKPYQKEAQGYEPHYPKPHQKQWVQDELPFNDKPWRETPLTDTEIEELFWRKLVQLGWRWQTYGTKLEKKNVVLPCPYCNLVIDSHTIITESNAKKMQDKYYCERILIKHKGLECKAISEDEVVSEATPKACYMCQGEGILQSGEECGC
jgi:hypothetical protein